MKKSDKRKLRSADRTRMLAPLPGGRQFRAFAKVGSNDVARLAWLLDLLNVPVGAFAKMSDKEFKDLEIEIGAFCEPLGSIEGGKRGILTVDMMEGLRREIFADIRALLDGASIDLQIPSVTLSVNPNL